ncbi:TolC family outer membrane protein [Undibacterium arcticum]|uniref:TolC family outer membrane protein n=1 Tax=Undibacterium arcticum TaxID=1762892 RepID=A0ABV7FAH0_9BURK
MKRRTVWPTLALACAAAAASPPASAETLREAVEQAVRTNPEVLASAHRRFAADEGVKQALGGYLPRIDLNAGTGRERLDSADTRLLGLSETTFARHDTSVTLSQMLFDGFAVQSEVARQRARVDSSAYGVAATAEDLALRTVGTYLEVLRRQETVVEAADNLDAHQRIYNQIRKLSESGVGRRADLDQAESRLALAKDNLRQEQSSLRDAEVSYVRLVGTPPRALLIPDSPDNALPPSEGMALDAASNGHPAVKSAEADVAVASALNSGAKAALSPRVDLELAANRGNDIVRGVTNDRTIMLRLRYNFSSGGADLARISETGFQVQEASEVLNRTRRQVQENVSLAYNANVTARDRLGVLRQYVDASAATRESYAKQFSIGQRTLLDLLNAENEYFNARLAYTTGQYAQLASAFRIFAGMGQLLGNLQITLPTEAVAVRGRSGHD